MQGYNAQAAATTEQIVVAAEVTVTTNDQPHFVPMATAVNENLTDAGHGGGVGDVRRRRRVLDGANGTAEVGAEVLIATRKTSWRKPRSPRTTSSRSWPRSTAVSCHSGKAGELLGVSYTWVQT